MGYEIAGGLGAKMAAPDREVYVIVGDGSYLMMAQELVTAVQENVKLIVVLVNNHGFASIGPCRRRSGANGSGRPSVTATPRPVGSREPVAPRFAANAKSLGVLGDCAHCRCRAALEEAKVGQRASPGRNRRQTPWSPPLPATPGGMWP